MRTKILHHTSMRSTKYGGIEQFIVNLNRQLMSADSETIIQYETMPDSKAFCDALAKTNSQLLIQVTQSSPLMSFFCSLAIYLKTRPTHIVTHFLSSSQYLACMVYRLFAPKTRLVSIFHLSPGLAKYSLATQCLTHFNAIVPVSVSVEKKLLKAGLMPAIVQQRYLGIFLNPDQLKNYRENRNQLRKQMGLCPHHVVVGCILFNHPVKGPDILVRAFANAYSDNQNLHMLLIGIDPDRDLEQLLKRHKIPASAITAPGIITEQAITRLAAADIYVQPSRQEALGLALIEAAAMGLPLIGANTGGIPEIVNDAITGELFPPGDSTQLAALLLKFSLDPLLRTKYGTGATKLYREQFNGHHNIRHTAEIVSGDSSPSRVITSLVIHTSAQKLPRLLIDVFDRLQHSGINISSTTSTNSNDQHSHPLSLRRICAEFKWSKLRNTPFPDRYQENTPANDTHHLYLDGDTQALPTDDLLRLDINGIPLLLAPTATLNLIALTPTLAHITIHKGDKHLITANLPLVNDSITQSLEKLTDAITSLLTSVIINAHQTAPVHCLPKTHNPPITKTSRLPQILYQVAKRRVSGAVRQYRYRQHWSIALSKIDSLTTIEQIRSAQWTVIDSPPRHNYLADPFLFTDYGGNWLLAEEYDHKRQKGFLIGYDITDCHQPKKMTQPLLELETHLSYPFTFTYEDKRYLMPENGSSGSLALYPLTAADSQLVTGAPILLGIDEAVYDATLFKHDNRYWIVGSTAPIDTNTHLSFWYAATPFGPWSAHHYTPVAIDVRFGRPAGTPFHHGKHLHLPLQNGALKYGDQINILRIDDLTPSTIRLTQVTSITKNDISIAGKSIEGIHTINFNGNTVAIDYFSYLPV